MRIREAIEQQGMTTQDVAKKIGITLSGLNQKSFHKSTNQNSRSYQRPHVATIRVPRRSATTVEHSFCQMPTLRERVPS